jgi:16S rRNA (adenine1518-N6/adenine1519-N6)-dimethyltransferase
MAIDPLHVPSLLRQYGIRPQKSLGQNFLADHNALVKIVRDAGVSHADECWKLVRGWGT